MYMAHTVCIQYDVHVKMTFCHRFDHTARTMVLYRKYSLVTDNEFTKIDVANGQRFVHAMHMLLPHPPAQRFIIRFRVGAYVGTLTAPYNHRHPCYIELRQRVASDHSLAG